MPILGSALKFRIGPLLDDSETAITGATWALVKAMKPDDSSFSVTYAENGGGFYTALTTAVSDQTGVWLLASQTTVNGVTYSDSSELDVLPDTGMTPARAAKLDSLGAGNIALTTAPIAVNGIIPLVQSTDYAASETRSLDWTTSDAGTWPDLTSATILFVARLRGAGTSEFRVAGSVISPSGAAKHVRVEIPAATTSTEVVGTYDYQVHAALSNTHVVPLTSGTLNLTEFFS